MAVSLDKIVPWGRSFDEYVRMFDLTAADLQSGILDCASGPASFNAEMFRRSCALISCDPIYQFSPAEIARRIDETCQTMLDGARQNRDNFLWREMESPERLGELRMRAMKQFLEDLPAGISEGRYRVGELPALPFGDGEFGVALCSHFLFTYSDALTFEFHLDSIRELCRIPAEVRIFPLLPSFGTEHSLYLPPVLNQLTAEGYRCEVRQVPYEFQKGGNEMLRVSRI